MPTSLSKIIEQDKIQNVKVRAAIQVEQETPLKSVLSQMQELKRGCALVTEKGKLLGIFTERDYLTRVIEKGVKMNAPIKELMTPNPCSLPVSASMAQAIELMSARSLRHLPLTNEQNLIEGYISVRDVLDYLSAHFPYEVYNLPPDPDQISKTAEGA